MVGLRRWWSAFQGVAILISFIINLVLIITLIVVVLLVFNIKDGILQPLVNGLYQSFVGLDQATILTTIHVSDTVPVKLTIPLQTNTTVILTNDVPLRANASFNLPGGGGTINGSVNIVLPTGLQLPVSLNLTVPVNDKLPVVLNVPVNIRIQDTQLHDAILGLENVLNPYVHLLGNLPSGWDEVRNFVNGLFNGKNLLDPTKFSMNPWPGYHTGLGTPVPTVRGAPTLPPINTALPGSQPQFVTPNGNDPNAAGPPGGAITATPFSAAPIRPTSGADIGIITPTPH